MIECERKGRWIGGCRFEARYDSKPGELPGNFQGAAAGLLAFLEASQQKTYVADVCIRCGKTIKRETN